MPSHNLFDPENVAGIFRGFRDGGLEFHADLVLPYRSDFQRIPMHGQFLLVQLEHPDEAVLGRITSLSSEGKLSVGTGEEFNIRAVREHREIPEDLREQYLKYRVDIRVLGVLRNTGDGLQFIASHRRLPHVGSPVAFPSGDVLREIAGHNDPGAELGYLALGEYIYAAGVDPSIFHPEPWMQVLDPDIEVKFSVANLVARRSFIFARAGFGKSNLNKLLFSTLYSRQPTVTKRGGREVPVGTVIFDPDGEYFWPDDRGRPGFCDVAGLRDQLVVFTDRAAPSPFYGSFVAGGIKLDIRRLKPADVIAIALDQERQDQQNVRKLRGLGTTQWMQLVDLVARDGYSASLESIASLLDLADQRQEAEALAARSNMTSVVRMLHDPKSLMMDLLMESLAAGKLCVVDVSQLRGGPSMVLSGLILRQIFDRNQREFTSADPKTIPTIAVIEEAQSVLQERNSAAEPYIAWVKEGRKYDLGAVLVTQQPGSIPMEILSQGDNWFIFHLLSSSDLQNVHKANAHFSDDLLSSLLNEPIPGQGVFWSSAGRRPYPVPIRALLFEGQHCLADPEYNGAAVESYASRLCDQFRSEMDVLRSYSSAIEIPSESSDSPGRSEDPESDLDTNMDMVSLVLRKTTDAIRADHRLMDQFGNEGVKWGRVKYLILPHVPARLDDRDRFAYDLVRSCLDRLFGESGVGWYTTKDSQGSTLVRSGSGSSR